MNYAAVGSGAGITAFSAKGADFGLGRAHDRPPSKPSPRAAPSVQVPVDLGAEMVAYNLPSRPAPVAADRPVIARVFLGQITSWHDPAVTALNPKHHTPGAPIFVVHRSDDTTTYIFSNYLSSMSPAWAAEAEIGSFCAGRPR